MKNSLLSTITEFNTIAHAHVAWREEKSARSKCALSGTGREQPGRGSNEVKKNLELC